MIQKNDIYEVIPIEQETPQHTMIYNILVGGKILMVAQLYPNGKWMTMGMSASTEITHVTHWLKLKHLTKGTKVVIDERQHQINKHGFTGQHHKEHPEWYEDGQLLSAARMLTLYNPEEEVTIVYRDLEPLNWDKDWWERLCDKSLEDRIRIASALCIAELDRIL